MTNPLISLRYPRVFGLYVVYALLYPLRQNGCAQVLWNVMFISASDRVLFPPACAPISQLFCSCLQCACVWSLALFGYCRLRQMYDICFLNLIIACLFLALSPRSLLTGGESTLSDTRRRNIAGVRPIVGSWGA